METGREVMHYALGDDKDYEQEWIKPVLAYLEDGYAKGKNEVEAGNDTYKVLRRENVTAFYDADGNTLFDIENERLKQEYEAMELVEADTEDTDENEPDGINDTQTADEVPQDEAQEISEEDSEEETTDNDTTAEEASDSPEYTGIDGAIAKLEEELKKAKDKTFADPVIKHLIERCRESESLASDVCQSHKNWEKCFKYIYEQARKQANGRSCAVRDDVVYEWAEDYYHRDDKAEEEKKAKETAEKKEKQEDKPKAETQKQKNPKPQAKAESKPEPKAEPKPKKNNNEMDGQLDMFSFMGM